MKTKLILILAIILFQSCKTQQLQTKTSSPQIENQIEGELDYAKGGFELVQWPTGSGGEEISLGRIDEKGQFHFSLPEYDIEALGKMHHSSSLEAQFNMLRCKGKGEFDSMGLPLFKPPYDDVYSQMYPAMYVKKYGVYIGYVSIVSDKKLLIKENFNKIIGNRYYWMYIDRDLDYKDTCIKESDKDDKLEVKRIADVQFKKGWNFIKANLSELQHFGEDDEGIMPKLFRFTASSYESKDVKWYLVRRMDDDKIEAAKKIYELEGQE